MGALLSIGLKLVKPLMIFLLFSIQYFSLVCYFNFFAKADGFNFGVVIIGIAIVLKLVLNAASFANFKVVQKYDIIATLLSVSIIDLAVFIGPFFGFFSRQILRFSRYKSNEAIRILSTKINSFIVTDFNALNHFQYRFSGFLLLYIFLATAIIIYFRKKYRKASK